MGVTKSIVVVSVCLSLLMVFPSSHGIGFNNKSSFKIAMFADLHFGENAWEAWGPAQDVNSTAVMSTLLDQESPGAIKPHAPLVSRIPSFLSLFGYSHPVCTLDKELSNLRLVLSWVIREDSSRQQVDGRLTHKFDSLLT